MAIPRVPVPLAMVRATSFTAIPLHEIWGRIFKEKYNVLPTFMRFSNFLTTGQQQPSFSCMLPVLKILSLYTNTNSISHGKLSWDLFWYKLRMTQAEHYLTMLCSVWFHFHMNKAKIVSKSILHFHYDCQWIWIYSYCWIYWMCIVWISYAV